MVRAVKSVRAARLRDYGHALAVTRGGSAQLLTRNTKHLDALMQNAQRMALKSCF